MNHIPKMTHIVENHASFSTVAAQTAKVSLPCPPWATPVPYRPAVKVQHYMTGRRAQIISVLAAGPLSLEAVAKAIAKGRDCARAELAALHGLGLVAVTVDHDTKSRRHIYSLTGAAK